LLAFLVGPTLVGAVVGVLCADMLGVAAAAGFAYAALGAGEVGAALWSERVGRVGSVGD
jgi:hypothetical protein